MAQIQLILCLLLTSSTFSAKLPSSFTKCDRKKSDFDKCLDKAIENGLSQLNKPIRDVGLPSMEPLNIPELIIGAGSGPVAFQQNLNDVKLSGFSKLKCSNTKFNFAEKKLTFECKAPEEIVMDFNYEISGKILLLPIYGKGPGRINLEKVMFRPTFELEEYDKKGEKHYKVKNYKLDLIPEKIRFKLENLFDGDKALGDNILQVMNDNWSDLFADVKPSYEEAFGKIFASIFDSLLSKVPVKDLFGEE